jgi:hypothetical protein
MSTLTQYRSYVSRASASRTGKSKTKTFNFEQAAYESPALSQPFELLLRFLDIQPCGDKTGAAKDGMNTTKNAAHPVTVQGRCAH